MDLEDVKESMEDYLSSGNEIDMSNYPSKNDK